MAEERRDWVVVRMPIRAETVTGLRVGGDRDVAMAGTDLPLLRLPDGRPYIPGSSVKGVLRSAAERLLAARGVGVCDILNENEERRCGGSGGRRGNPVAYDELCWPCRLFGSPHWAGRLWCGDLAPDGAVPTVVRDGVAIDRGELKAADRLKFDYEVVPPGAVLQGEVRVDDPEPGDVGLVLALWDLVDAGIVTFGGGASRGLGRLRLLEPVTPSRLAASTWRPGSAPELLDRAALDAELDDRLAEVGARREGGGQDGG